MRKQSLISMALLIVGFAAVIALASCSSGRSEAEFNALQAQLAARDKELADLKQQAQTAPSAPAKKDPNLILAAIPNAPLRATPTPAPPGFTPPPAPQPPAAQAEPIAFYVDTVTSGAGESQFKVDASLTCVRNSAFKRGMHVVWRMRAVDTATGKEIQRDDMQSAVLKLPNGDTRNFAFGRHGPNPDSPWFWATAWDVPLDYPLGTIDYTVEVASKSGRKGTFKEIPVKSAQLQVVE